MPAVHCWPWGVFGSWLASRNLSTARSSYLAWVGPVLWTNKSWAGPVKSWNYGWEFIFVKTGINKFLEVRYNYVLNNAFWICLQFFLGTNECMSVVQNNASWICMPYRTAPVNVSWHRMKRKPYVDILNTSWRSSVAASSHPCHIMSW